MGFTILIFFVIIPLLLVLVVASLVWPREGVVLWKYLISIFVFLLVMNFILDRVNDLKLVTKKKIIGRYVIDRNMFHGENADWQFNHYLLEITNNEFIVKYHDHGKILSKDSVAIIFLEQYKNNRLSILGSTEHHMFQENPTLVRDNWNFHYVFESKKFGNMYLTKGEWSIIKE